MYKLLSGIFFSLAVSNSLAATFPEKSITIVVPYGAGGIADVVARTFGESMAKSLGQTVVVMNKPGAHANIGPSIVSKEKADGYTLVLSSTSMALNPYIDKNPGWKLKQFTPVARLAVSPNVFLVPASSGQKTLRDFVEYAHTTDFLPTNVTSYGNSQSINREIFAEQEGIKFTAVGYKGGTSYFTDIVNGALVFSVLPAGISLPWINDKQIVALAVSGENRIAELPDVPTLAELGYKSATAVSWFGLHAPAGTPAEVVEKLEHAASIAAKDPVVKERLAGSLASTAFQSHKEFEDFVENEAKLGEKLASIISN